MKPYIVNFEGRGVECYGSLEENSNFAVVCEDEDDEDVWCNADPRSGNPFEDWESAVSQLQTVFDSPIVEIWAC